jgi:1-acyl-sn-glycerol-3-phosphate acyltransferase
MNPFAYRTTGLAIKTLENLSKARVNLHGTENLPRGATIFVMNHFTRLETFLMPYYLHKLTRMPVWSIAAAELFVGALGRYLESVGAVSTKHPDRDRLIVKSLLTSEADWIIFPEGRMVKSKKIIEKGRYMISFAGGKHPPHTGAAVLALRTEFYRQRILQLSHSNPERDSIQRTGRVARLFVYKDGRDKKPIIVHIYLKNTKDEDWFKRSTKNAVGIRYIESLDEILQSESFVIVS